MKPSLLLPGALILGGCIIAGALYFALRPESAPTPAADLSRIRPVSEDDHMLGNPAAPIVFVEYCDIDAPFCENWDGVLKTVMANYGASGQVAWVYRHLPIVNQHPNAETAAEAAECAASAGGSAAFFAFVDAAAHAPQNAQSGLPDYGAAARAAGVDPARLSSCLSAHAFKDRVAEDANEALTIGATGAPYTVLLVKGYPPIPISGALSYEQLNGILAAALAETK